MNEYIKLYDRLTDTNGLIVKVPPLVGGYRETDDVILFVDSISMVQNNKPQQTILIYSAPSSITPYSTSGFVGTYSTNSYTSSTQEGIWKFLDRLTTVGTQAFYNKSTVTSITLPNSVIEIGEKAFYGCSGLKKATLSDQLKTLGASAFYNCSTLQEVELGTHLNTLSDSAFYGCVALTNITLPNTLKEIQQNAFYGSGLTSIEIPESVTTLGSNIFSTSNQLESIRIPKSVVNIPDHPIGRCSSMTSIIVDPENPKYDSRDNCNALIDSTTHILMDGCKTSTVPSGVLGIGKEAFYGRVGLQNLDLPFGVKTIGQSAFEVCTDLQEINLSGGVETIESECFYQCSSLRNIQLPVGLTSIGSKCFYQCTALQSVFIPGTLVDIPLQCFDGCSALTTLEFDEGIRTIGRYAFRNCTNLQSVELPYGVTKLDGGAFQGCTKLANISIPETVSQMASYYSSRTYYGVFRNCQSLTSVRIPKNITSLGRNSFYGCSSLRTVFWDVKSISDPSYEFFVDTPNVTTFVIGEDVERIPKSLCRNMTSLSALHIPSKVSAISTQIISGTNVSTLTVDENNTTFDSRNDCNAVIKTSDNSIVLGCKSTIIPDTVTSIGQYAFYYCTGLNSLTIPNSINNIGNYAFTGCSNLQQLVVLNPTPCTIGSNSVFPTTVEIIVPAASEIEYKNTSGWSTYSSQITSKYTPQECTQLTITADNVNGRQTTTTIYWQAVTKGVDYFGNIVDNILQEGEVTSEEFGQNESDEAVTRTISFTYMGVTATTTITQDVIPPQSYTVVLNSQWQLSTSINNPDSSIYDGVYESFSNKGINSQAAIMYIDIDGYDNFTVYIRSYAESSYDYVMISQPDVSINNSTSYSNTSYVKQYTRGYQNSGTSIGSYRTASYTGLGGTHHRITVVYRKDSSQHSNQDRGYVLIPKNQ